MQPSHIMGLTVFLFTLPLAAPAQVEPVFSNGVSRIAFGSCLYQDRPQPIWQAVLAAQPEMFIFLGDNVNKDTTNLEEKVAAYAQLAAQPGYQQLLSNTLVLATWNDHDYGMNDSGAEYPMREAARDIFLDFFDEPDSSPRRQHSGVYDARIFGPPGRQVQVILLDTRYFRGPLKRIPNPQPGDGPYEASRDRSISLLGPEQWTWFREQLRRPAQLRIIASSIQVLAEDHRWEKWMNLPHERRRLLDMLSDTEADGVLFISGDRHLAELSMLRGAANYPLYDLTSGSMSLSADIPPGELNRHRVSDAVCVNSFGLITIDWNRPDPLIRLEIRDEKGAPRIAHQVFLTELQCEP